MNDLISVIVPVYNVEKYLRDCLDSIVNQTYSNLQIILIDDGSTDSSGTICDEYANGDNRVTVVHQQNQGAGAAKNTGLELIKGDYFSIVDADDYLELNTYEIMLSYSVRYNADIVQCLFRKVFVDAFFDRNYLIPYQSVRKINVKRFLKEYLFDWKYAIFANKLFKSGSLQDVRFKVGKRIDDEFFTYKIVCNAKTIVNIPNVLYNYRIRESSVMNKSDQLLLINDRIECFVERYYYISKCFPTLEKRYYYALADYLMYCKKQYGEQDFIVFYMKKFPIEKIGIIGRTLIRIFTIKTKSDFNPDERIKSKFD